MGYLLINALRWIVVRVVIIVLGIIPYCYILLISFFAFSKEKFMDFTEKKPRRAL